MPRGRKPKPTALLKLRGSYNPTLHGKRRRHEPRPAGDLSEPPLDLTEGQEAIWRYAVANMPPGVLKRIDREMLLIWCEAADRHNTARLMQAMLDRDAKLKLLIKTPEGLIASPYNDILDKAARLMLRAAQELGFSPAARPRVHADISASATNDRADPWAGLRLIRGGKERPPD